MNLKTGPLQDNGETKMIRMSWNLQVLLVFILKQVGIPQTGPFRYKGFVWNISPARSYILKNLKYEFTSYNDDVIHALDLDKISISSNFSKIVY